MKESKIWIGCSIFVLILTSFLSAYYVSDMNILEDYGRYHAIDILKRSIEEDVASKYPGLPQSEQNRILLQSIKEEDIESLASDTAESFKQEYEGEDGRPYVYGNDPFFYVRQARNLAERGTIYDMYQSGNAMDRMRNAPHGSRSESTMLPNLIFWIYTILSPFGIDSIESAAFILPAILLALSSIVIFLITKRLSDTQCGLIAGFLFAVNPVLTQGMHAGFADTNALNIFMSCLVMYVMVILMQNLDLFGQAWKHRKDLMCAAKKLLAPCACFIALWALFFIFKFTWTGYFYIFAIAAAGIVVFSIVKIALLARKSKIWLLVLLGFLAVKELIIYIAWDMPFMKLVRVRLGLDATTKSFFPSASATVQELLPISPKLLGSIHGGQYIFFLTVIAFFMIMYVWIIKEKRKRDYGCLALLATWYLMLVFASVNARRFAIYLILPVSIIIGIGMKTPLHYLLDYVETNLGGKHDRVIGKIVFCIVACALLFAFMLPGIHERNRAQSSSDDILREVMGSKLPNMDDNMDAVLKEIEARSHPEAIITAWWDYGYLMQYVARRPTILDGGNFNLPRSYWIARALLETDIEKSKNIINMLACGGEAYTFNHLVWVSNETEAMKTMHLFLKMSKQEIHDYLWDNNMSQIQYRTTSADNMTWKTIYLANQLEEESYTGYSFSDFYKTKYGEDIHAKLNTSYLSITSDDEIDRLFKVSKGYVDNESYYDQPYSAYIGKTKYDMDRYTWDSKFASELDPQSSKEYYLLIRQNRISAISMANRLYFTFHVDHDIIEKMFDERLLQMRNQSLDPLTGWMYCEPKETYLVVTEDLLFKFSALDYLAGWDFERPKEVMFKKSPFMSMPCYGSEDHLKCADGTTPDTIDMESRFNYDGPKRFIVSADGKIREKEYNESASDLIHIVYKKKSTWRSFVVREKNADMLMVRLILFPEDHPGFSLFSFHDDGDVSKRTVAYRVDI